MKERVPIIVVAVAVVLVVALGVRLRLNLSTPPPPQASQPVVAETSTKRDYSARVEERLRMLRSEHVRRQADDGGGSEEASSDAPQRRGRPTPGNTAEPQAAPQMDRRRAAVDLPVPNAAVGHSTADLKHSITSHPSREKRIEAARELGATDEPDAVEVLIEAMSDHDAEVRAAVVEALGDHLDDLTPDMLQPVLKDRDANVRFEAVTLLGLIGGPEAMAAAVDLKDDPDPDVRDLVEEVQRVLATDPTPLPAVTPPRRQPVPRPRH